MNHFYIVFTCMDGKQVPVYVKEAEISEFFKSLSEGQIFWCAEEKTGFWIALSTVRFLTASLRDAPTITKKEPEVESPALP